MEPPRRPRTSGLSHAEVPHRRPWHKPIFEPVVLASNLVLWSWVWPAWKTATTAWDPPLAELERLQHQGRPLIFFTWHAYEAVGVFAFRDLPPSIRPIAIGHDGTKSRMLQRGFHWLGVDIWVYRRRSPVTPKQQIINLLRAQAPHIALAADAGGPYGRVRPSLTELAQAGDAFLMPFVVTGERIVRLRWPRRYLLPLPYCRLQFHFAPPLDGRHASPDDCQAALDGLERHLRVR